MSRTEVQKILIPRDIFVTWVRQADRTKKPVMSSKALCEQSIQVTENSNMSSALFLLMTLCSQGNVFYRNQNTPFLCYEVVMNVLGYLYPISEHQQLESLGNYAVAINRPSSIFRQIEMDPYVIVNAAIRGQEDIVLNILRADPSYLLKKAIIKNSVGVEYEVTPLQAAIIANDVQLIEHMKIHFMRLADSEENPIDGLAEMQQQMLAIYQESLARYCNTPQEKIDAFLLDDLHSVIEAHNQAQERNAFDFQPYVDAICNIDLNDPLQKQQLDDVIALINANTPKKTKAVIAKTKVSSIEMGFTDQVGRTYTREEVQALPFDQLTLIQILNRFREKLVEHRQKEIISNPHHVIKSGKHNDDIWNAVCANLFNDPNQEKRSIIYSQIYGFAQVTADEAVRQDFRQGTYYLTHNSELHLRPSHPKNRFRPDYQGDFPVNHFSYCDWGYKFAIDECGSANDWSFAEGGIAPLVSKLISNKNSALSALVAELARACPSKSERWCVIS